MIGRLRGILSDKQPPWLVLDVQGVGYEVEAPMSTFFQLPATGEEVSLFTHLVVREDAQLLYGFAAADERRLFRELIRISGIGPRVALAILSGMDATEFSRCMQCNDTAALIRLPGIGKKTAERLWWRCATAWRAGTQGRRPPLATAELAAKWQKTTAHHDRMRSPH